MGSTALQQHQARHGQQGEGWTLRQPLPGYYQMDAQQGQQGYGDINQFGQGLVLGRGLFAVERAYQDSLSNHQTHFGVTFILQGHYDLNFPQLQQQTRVQSRQLWCRRGVLGDMHSTIPAQAAIAMVTLDFPADMLQRWEEDVRLPQWLRRSLQGDEPQMTACPQLSANLLMQAQHLVRMPLPQHFGDQMALEAGTLQLISQLMQWPLPQGKIQHFQRMVDEVVDVIKAEYMLPLTIADLARRVGTNECYLKQQFKAHMGQTVAQFIRQCRMANAVVLLAQGIWQLQEIACFVGYRSPSHFSKVFKEIHGYAPSDVVK